jgi:hypothetical protein
MHVLERVELPVEHLLYDDPVLTPYLPVNDNTPVTVIINSSTACRSFQQGSFSVPVSLPAGVVRLAPALCANCTPAPGHFALRPDAKPVVMSFAVTLGVVLAGTTAFCAANTRRAHSRFLVRAPHGTAKVGAQVPGTPAGGYRWTCEAAFQVDFMVTAAATPPDVLKSGRMVPKKYWPTLTVVLPGPPLTATSVGYR